MQRATLIRYTVGYTVAVAVGATAGWWLTLLGGERHPSETATLIHSLDGRGTGQLTIRGDIAHLTPGKPMKLSVYVSNPNDSPIRLLTLDVAAGDASPACRSASSLTVGSYRSAAPGAPAYIVPGHGTIVLQLPI